MKVRALLLSLAMMLGTEGPTQAQPAPSAPACGAKLAGDGAAIQFPSPLPEPDRIGLLASLHLTLTDSSGRGTWPLSEIDIALPCEIASFPVGDDIWVISGGDGYAPPRWARATGHDETYFLAAGPSLVDAGAWAANQGVSSARINRPIYYLVGVAAETHFVFKAYQGSPSGKQLADDLFGVITGKTAPIGVYDPKGSAAGLFLLTQSRRTSEVYTPERLIGDRSATLYGPDGDFFTPAPNEAVLLRGSDLRCDARYGDFERVRLGVLEPGDANLDLSCHYEAGESYMTLFSSRLPDPQNDRARYARAIKQSQDEDGVTLRLPDYKTGVRETLQGGKSWIDKTRLGQSIWFMRRGDYVYEIRGTFPQADDKAFFSAMDAFVRSTAPETESLR